MSPQAVYPKTETAQFKLDPGAELTALEQASFLRGLSSITLCNSSAMAPFSKS
jgi:hypothetical protein